MALGGGNYTAQNKILPGTYINFVSAARAGALLSERGHAALPLMMDWGPSGEVFTLKAEEFQNKSRTLFGYDYSHEAVKGIRDLFKHARVLYGCRVNGKGVQAACDYGTARYAGVRGNSLRMVIRHEGEQFAVTTLLDQKEIDSQTVSSAGELKDTGEVLFKKDAALAETAGVPFTGGTNGKPALEDYQKFLDLIESYSFHALGLLSDDESVKKLFTDFTRRMRDEQGIKFQTVLYQWPADYEGIISLENHVIRDKETDYSLVYWTTGASAGCAVNASNTNQVYDGEYPADTSYTQKELEAALQKGSFILHKVGEEVRVLEDINSLTTFTEEKGEDFKSNQTMRVLDQIGNDIASLFGSKYLGRIPNDEAGRISFWNDVVSYYRELNAMRAIEGFQSGDIVVSQGENKKSIVASCPVKPVNAMSQLYMTVVVQ